MNEIHIVGKTVSKGQSIRVVLESVNQSECMLTIHEADAEVARIQFVIAKSTMHTNSCLIDVNVLYVTDPGHFKSGRNVDNLDFKYPEKIYSIDDYSKAQLALGAFAVKIYMKVYNAYVTDTE